MIESDSDSIARVPDASGLPLAESQLAVERCLLRLDGKIRNCGRNAFQHLRLAWSIRELDPEMAAFRAITAEEEAASALILAIQQKRYPKSQFLNHRNHAHKTAVIPFLHAVARVFETMSFAKPTLSLNEHATPPTLQVKVNMQNVGAELSEPLYCSPDQPFNFVIRDGHSSSDVYLFDEELRDVAKGQGLEEIVGLIREEANIRNRLLYAADGGIPHVEVKDEFFLRRAERVTAILLLTIGVNQTAMHQLFAVQCLHAFLRALNRIGEADVELPEVEAPNGPSVVVEKIGDKPPEAWITQKWSVVIPLTFHFGAPGMWRVSPM